MNLEKKKLSVRKNDLIQVMAGREKGKTGKVLKVSSKDGRVTVEKLNLVKRHTKAAAGATGGIVEKESPIHYSNVLLLCSKCNRGVRHGYKSGASTGDKSVQKKVRVCKRCGNSLDPA